MFRDRQDAANQLAEALGPYAGRNPLVLAIPRGAVPMARTIAGKLGGEFDLVLVRKLCAPYQPEFAIGAIDESGWTYVAPHAIAIDAGYLAQEKCRQLETIRRRRAQYTPVRAPIDPAGRIVIVVDDGLATGATMIAALHGLKHRRPAELVCAVPVAPADSLEKIRALGVMTVCLEVPLYFQSVGQFYENFPQVEDEEVVALLAD
ncbi:MAG TPA: phosphoribosyltransferase family protein [Arenimonas sp.]|nr:phosphoribosyltransferase family protein [Arenimonas sp.]